MEMDQLHMDDLVEVSNNDLFKNLLNGGKNKEEDEPEPEHDENEEKEEKEESDIENSDIENSDIEDSDIDEDDLSLDIEGDSQAGGDANKITKKNAKNGGMKAGARAGAGTSGAGTSGAGTSASGAGTSGADTAEDESTTDDESDDDDDYLQKFNLAMRDDLILNFHPESKSHNYEEIKQLAKVTRNKNGIIVDELHKTIPFLTKYEKTRILGQRAKQIESGAVSLVQVPPNVIDSYLIAKLELAQNKIPFIIRRPLPNGGMEYWYVSDLENNL